jgi:hypothetical protein
MQVIEKLNIIIGNWATIVYTVQTHNNTIGLYSYFRRKS